jgi:uncharacterized coiled-coil DUF342 family protein
MNIEELKKDRNEWCSLAHEAGSEIGGLGHMWCAKYGLVDRARNLREERDTLRVRVAELKSTHPPEDWLTRAIDKSGAPEGSDWAGLLEHVGRISALMFGPGPEDGVAHVVGKQFDRYRAQIEELKAKLENTKSSSICALVCEIGDAIGYPPGHPLFDERRGIVAHARVLSERADSAQAKVTEIAIRQRDELDTKLDESNAMLANANSRIEEHKRKAEDLKTELTEAQRSRKEAEQRKEAVENDSNDLYRWMRCLLDTAETAEESPTPCGYAWPDPDMGGLHALAVPYRVIRKLAEERDKLKAELKQGQEKLTIMSERASVAEAELEQMHLRPRQNGETGSNDARLSNLEAKVESLIFIRDI